MKKSFKHSQHQVGPTNCNHIYFYMDKHNRIEIFHWFVIRDYSKRLTGFKWHFGRIQGKTPKGIGYEYHCGFWKYFFAGKLIKFLLK